MTQYISRRGFLAGAGALALGAGLAACSGGNGGATSSASSASTDAGKVTGLTWSTWGATDELKRMTEFTDDFNKNHPLIKATLQPVPSYGDYNTKLLSQLTSGTAPDVFYIGDDVIGKYVDADVLLPLGDLLRGSSSQSKPDDFGDGLWSVARDGDTILAVPNDCNPDVFWYDKTALAAAGITDDPAELAAAGKWTVATLLDMCAKLADKGMAGAIFWNYWATHWSWVVANGGTVYDDSGAFVLPDDAKSVAALDSLAKAFQSKQFLVADDLPAGGDLDSLFAAHKAGFAVQGRYTISVAQQSGSPDQYDIAPWPSTSGEIPASGVAASYLAINKNTPHPEQAFEFLTNYVSAAGQKFRLAGGGNAVPSIKGADDIVLDGYPAHAQTFLDLRDKGFEDFVPEVKVPGLSGDIATAMADLYSGAADTAATVAAVQKLIDDANADGS